MSIIVLNLHMRKLRLIALPKLTELMHSMLKLWSVRVKTYGYFDTPSLERYRGVEGHRIQRHLDVSWLFN